jgi:hypothetical protein
MKDWDAESVRKVAVAARDEAIEIEKQAIVNCINEAAKRGYYDYTMEIEYREVVNWLTDKGFTIMDKGSAKTVSWAPITVARWEQISWA